MRRRTLTYFCNCLNHHLIGVCDEIHKQLGDDFKFVVTKRYDISSLKGGEDYNTIRNYCIRAYEGIDEKKVAQDLARYSDVCVFGSDSLDYMKIRAKEAPSGLSLEGGERWLKRGMKNIISPSLLKWWTTYHLYCRKANFYYLSASAYAYQDLLKLGAYKNRCFKWGYFVDIDKNYVIKGNQQTANGIMWCARFLDWKHPEIPVELAALLKRSGYQFSLDMYGDGIERQRIEQLISDLHVEDVVTLKGSMPNDEIQKAMREHSIFLFTSDRREGWGVVAGEAMGNGCALVACKEIGCVPYLVEDGKTGLTYEKDNKHELYEKVKLLLENPSKLKEIRIGGNLNMKQLWNPQSAVDALLNLIEELIDGRPCSITLGPCSKA